MLDLPTVRPQPPDAPTPRDGDDYTYDKPAGGLHLAPAGEQFTVEQLAASVRPAAGFPVVYITTDNANAVLRIHPTPDLRTADQRTADELAALRAVLAELSARVRVLESVIARHADAIQPLVLAAELTEPPRSSRTSDDYVPAVAVWPDGKRRRCTVQAVKLDDVAGARKKLAAGKVAWVRPADVERVLAARGEAGADGAVD